MKKKYEILLGLVIGIVIVSQLTTHPLAYVLLFGVVGLPFSYYWFGVDKISRGDIYEES